MADTRFEVRLNDKFAQDFDAIAAETGLSREDVFRRAIALYQVAKRAEMANGHIIIRSKDGTEHELISI
jgi:metal-responsive CopG/Arc/MetJ family transcriptional regulator